MRSSLLHRAVLLLLVFGLGGVLVPALHDVAHAMEAPHAPSEAVYSVDQDDVACALCDVLLTAEHTGRTDVWVRSTLANLDQVPPVAPALSFAAPFLGRAPPVLA